MTERVRDMLAIIEHLQTINRSMLNRLRPMALGHVPLRRYPVRAGAGSRAAALRRSRSRSRRDKLVRSYGDSVDLTIYRCVQESLTNAIRHAQAKHVDVELGEAATRGTARRASLRSPSATTGAASILRAPMGFGLHGMQERVQGARRPAIRSKARCGRGTCVRIADPGLRERTRPA